MINITRIKILPVQGNDKLKAYVDMVLNDSFMVRNVKVIEGAKGLFLSMPSKKMPGGNYRDIFHPINNSTRETIETAVINEYFKAIRLTD